MNSDDLSRLPIPMFSASGIPLNEANDAWYPTLPNSFSRFGLPEPLQPSLKPFPFDEGIPFNQMDSRFPMNPKKQIGGSQGQDLYSQTEIGASSQSHHPVDPNSHAGMDENVFDLWNNLPYDLEYALHHHSDCEV